MRKKLFAGLLMSASVLGVCVVSGVTADAATIEQDTEIGITFTDHDPGKVPGPLEFKYVPNKFDFGTGKKLTDTSFAEVSGQKKYVVVSDTRAGATDKWEVYAKLSNVMSGTEQLTGAQVKFNATKQGYQGTGAPEAPGSIVAPTGSATVTAPSVTLSQGAAATKVMEDGTAGTGTYQGATAMEMSTISLDAPANAGKAGLTYSGKITWSLDDTL